MKPLKYLSIIKILHPLVFTRYHADTRCKAKIICYSRAKRYVHHGFLRLILGIPNTVLRGSDVSLLIVCVVSTILASTEPTTDEMVAALAHIGIHVNESLLDKTQIYSLFKINCRESLFKLRRRDDQPGSEIQEEWNGTDDFGEDDAVLKDEGPSHVSTRRELSYMHLDKQVPS